MRSKEEANDYRYFPDPDLLPVEIDDELIASITASMPELPDVKKQRYIDELGLAEADANSLITDKTTADYFEAVLAGASGTDPKLTANWILGELFARLNKDSLILENSPVDASAFAGLMQRLDDKTLSGKLGKQVLDAMWAGEGSADDVIEAKGLKQITDTGEIEKLIDEVIAANPSQVAEYRGGKDKLIGFFVGNVMKASGGKANPAQLNQLLKEKLKG